ncbi:transcription factor NIGT1-like [Carex rostrata]
MLSSMDLIEKTRRYQDYIHALEEERCKIQVFQRELPLCLQLVSQTIENVKYQIDSMGSGETASDGPVLEEFIPLKPSLSSSDEESAHDLKKGSEKKADWLQSVQLWNQEPDASPPALPVEPPCKPIAVNARKMGGAFQPFEKEKLVPLPATSAGTTSSTAGVSSGAAATSSYVCAASESKDKEQEKEKETDSEKGNDKGKDDPSQNNRKARRCWSPELHRRFLHALQQIGGSHVATPKQIRELMKVDGLTNDEVKSHLQKYRLHTRRPNSSAAQSSTNCSQPGPQFVVVGGIWVPPQDYAAAAAAAAAAQPSADIKARSSRIYTPVASVPSPHQQNNKRLLVNGPRCNGNSEVSPKSASPSTSSSSQTTTASPPF